MPRSCADNASYSSDTRNATLNALHRCANSHTACTDTAYSALPEKLRPVASLVDPRRMYRMCAEYSDAGQCLNVCRRPCAHISGSRASEYTYNASVHAVTPIGRVDEEYTDERVILTGATYYCPEEGWEYEALVVGIGIAALVLMIVFVIAAGVSLARRAKIKHEW